MSITDSIKAFFNFNGQRIQIDVLSAHIKNGIARLRSLSEGKIYEIHSKKISIMIDNDEEEDSVKVIDHPDADDGIEEEPPVTVEPQKHHRKHNSEKSPDHRTKRPATEMDFILEKKTFATGFYESERLEIVSAYKSAKAKRDEYLLACVRAASPRKVNQELKKIRKERETMQDQVETNTLI